MPIAPHRTPSVRIAFLRELHTTAQMQHPNLVRILDGGQAGTVLYMAMERLYGFNLEELVRRYGPLPFERAVQCLVQATQGLEYTHRKGLVLRDVKPANLFLALENAPPAGATLAELFNLNWTIKLLDLGLAVQMPRLVSSGTGQRAGTPLTIAPEQADNSGEIDIRADIYGLGASFYFLLTGQYPFAARTWEQLADCHRHAQPDPVEYTRPDVPPGLHQILERMLAKDPNCRFAGPAELLASLQPFYSGSGPFQAPPTPYPAITTIAPPKVSVQVTAPGVCYERARFHPQARWIELVRTPTLLVLHPRKEYRLCIAGRLLPEQLADALEPLRQMHTLVALELQGNPAPVDDPVLQRLGTFPALAELELRPSAAVTDAGIAHLGNLLTLRRLSLTGPSCWRVRDAALAELVGKLRYLETLDLSNTAAGLLTLPALGTLSYLEELSLRECELLTDGSLRQLLALKRLRRLDLSGCKTLTDAAALHLREMTGLQDLNLVSSGLTGMGIEQLRNWLKGCHIKW
jgi:hypothetical protein